MNMAFFHIRDRSVRRLPTYSGVSPASAFVLFLSCLDATIATAYTAPTTPLVRTTLETTTDDSSFLNQNGDTWLFDDTSVNDLPISLGMHTSTQSTVGGYSVVYIFGGCAGDFGAIPGNADQWPWRCTVISDYAFSYDPYTDSYQTLAKMPLAKYGHTATAVDGHIWVIGGRSRSENKDQIDHQVDIYDIANDSWETIRNFGMATANGAAFSLESGSLYYAGGFDDSYTATDAVIQITTTRLDEKMFTFTRVASLNVARGMVHAVTTAKGAILAGGTSRANPCQVIDSIEEYIPGLSKERWELVEGFPSLNGAHPSSLIRLGDEIVTFTSVRNDNCSQDPNPISHVQALNWRDRDGWYAHGDIDERRFYFATVALPERNAALTFGGTTFYDNDCDCMKTLQTVSAYYTPLPDEQGLFPQNNKMDTMKILAICGAILLAYLLVVYFLIKLNLCPCKTSSDKEGGSNDDFPLAEEFPVVEKGESSSTVAEDGEVDVANKIV